MPRFDFARRRVLDLSLLLAISFSIDPRAARAETSTFEPPVAITGVTIVSPNRPALDDAIIVIKDGRIVDYGQDISVPANADILDAAGLYAYPGFVSAYTHLGIPDDKRDEDARRRLEDENPAPSERALSHTRLANRRGIRPQFRAEEHFAAEDEKLDAYRKSGFATVYAAPRYGILGGTMAAINLSGAPRRRAILATELGQRASFSAGEPGDYPASILGVFAQFRQVMLDTGHSGLVREYYERHPNRADRPPFDPAFAPLHDVLSQVTPLVFQADSEHAMHRAITLAREVDARVILSGAKEAYKLIDVIQKERVSLIVSLKFDEEPEYGKKKGKKKKEKEREKEEEEGSRPRPPDAPDGDDKAKKSTKDDKKIDEPLKLRKERRRLWEEQVDNVVRLYEAEIPFALSMDDFKKPSELFKNVRMVIERGLPEDVALRALTATPAEMFGLDGQIGDIAAGKLAHISLFTKPFSDEKAKVRYAFVEGRKFEYNRDDEDEKAKDKDEEDGANDASSDEESSGGDEVTDSDTDTPEDDSVVEESQAAAAAAAEEEGEEEDAGPTWRCEILADRNPSFQTGGSVLIRDATVIPVSGPTIDRASILVENGKISAIGPDVTAPPGVHVIDATGLYVVPGFVDAHSHMAIDGVNEGSLSVTAEVRIADVVNNDSVGIYRALAGGATTTHAMHGSANPIGGQNVIFKLKYLRPVDDMIVHDAPRTMKWALGENVKQSNWSGAHGKRFPNGRMGVEAVIRDALISGRQYDAEWSRYRSRLASGEDVLPPRRDLRREAMADVLRGDIWVHTHCYRSDEILRLMHTAEDFGIRIAVLQHVLEGYRIAPEIARHGASGSTFSNFWAYKIEAYGSIPHNAALMTEHGINVSVNSDSANTIRYLNLEAAKCVKWGGLGEIEALRLVTLNPAIQLGIDHRVGSIELGKDADLAIFNGHPLNAYARNVFTLIEGEVYFEDSERAPIVPAPALDWVTPADLTIPQSPHRLFAITGGTVHTISGGVIENGVVIIRNELIDAVGEDIPIPPGAGVIDATGRHVYPGMIDAGGNLGLTEIGSLRATQDDFDIATFGSELKAASAIHPHSAHIRIARSAGTTTQLATPGRGRVSGQSALIHLDGWTADEMLVDNAVALHMSIPSLPARLTGDDKEKRKERHDKEIREIEDFLAKARIYAKARHAGETDPDLAPPFDARLEAMISYLSGDKPIIVSAHGYKHMLDVIEFAEKHDLKLILSGATQSWKIADLLAEKNIPVILSKVLSYPSGRFEAWDSIYRCASELDRAGVRWCFASDSASNAYDLSLNAGFAVAHGLRPDRAAYALTLGAADILGVGDSLGSLEVGKLADVIVTTHDITQTVANVTHMFISGNPVELSSLHTESYEKFRSRPKPALPQQKELIGPPSFTRTH
jgi:imidazolonepropionase-like amidohydrolase